MQEESRKLLTAWHALPILCYMPSGTLWPIWNKITNGKLDSILLEAKIRNLPPARIAQELYAKYSVSVSDATVRTWLQQIEEEGAP